MSIEEKIAIVTRLQLFATEVFTAVTKTLIIGMSEFDISEMIRSEFQKRGITEYWYNVPRNVLIGTERFKIGTTTSDYTIKGPSDKVFLEEGSALFIDVHPMDSATKVWGDWATTVVFHPRPGIDDDQVQFLKDFRETQRKGIATITTLNTGASVANYYSTIFKQKGVTLLDVRNNVGHSIHEGPKEQAQRVWLASENHAPLGEGIFTIEPGGSRMRKDGKGIVVARFEECIYIPKIGHATIIGNFKELPLSV